MLAKSIRTMGLAAPGAAIRLVPLTGGVSSLIARVETDNHVFCVKAALAKLRVAANWEAPVDRNRYEVAWMRVAAEAAPSSTPEVLGDDPTHNVFAMTWLDPVTHPVWKDELLAGRVAVAVAAALGDVVGRIHAATADRSYMAAAFATDANFHALRLEPYLEATARRHADLAPALTHLVARTAGTRRVLVHGDVSPKNILVSSNGPVLLDAECAWFGDPAFDLAFCLNHLALKGVYAPATANLLRDAADALWGNYRQHVGWETPDAVEQRVATLLPGLALARVDGKSPVEYLDADAARRVRDAARDLLHTPSASLAEFHQRWAELTL